MSLTRSEQLAAFAEGLSLNDIPATVVERVRLHALDTIGVGLIGHREPSARMVVEEAGSWGGPAVATVWGSSFRLPAPAAAMCNGALVHAYDYDDTHQGSVAHLSASLIPALVATAEESGAGGDAVITAAVAGYEIGARIGLTAPHRFNANGFHGTPLFGTFAVAAAAAKLLGLKAGGIADAIGIAGSLASGNLQFIRETASSIKRLHPGWGAHCGLIAARLAARGFDGARLILEGPKGLLRSHLQDGKYDENQLTADLGNRWESANISIKPYPCCAVLHASLDAALDLRREHNIDYNEIAWVEALLDEPDFPILVEPRSIKDNPPNPHTARFSMSYGLAVVLVRGSAGFAEFESDALNDPQVLDLARRVRIEPDHDTDFPKHMPGKVTVVLRDGKRLRRDYLNSRGSPDRPLSNDEVRGKFMDNALIALPSAQAERVAELVLSLEQLASVRDLTAALSRLPGGEKM